MALAAILNLGFWLCLGRRWRYYRQIWCARRYCHIGYGGAAKIRRFVKCKTVAIWTKYDTPIQYADTEWNADDDQKVKIEIRSRIIIKNNNNNNKSAQSNLGRGPRGGAFAHVRHEVLIDYNGAPQIRPQKYLIPWTDRQTPPSASSLDPSDLRCQTAVGSDPPFFHNALDRQTDQPNDRSFTGGITRESPRATRPNDSNIRICIAPYCRNFTGAGNSVMSDVTDTKYLSLHHCYYYHY